MKNLIISALFTWNLCHSAAWQVVDKMKTFGLFLILTILFWGIISEIEFLAKGGK